MADVEQNVQGAEEAYRELLPLAMAIAPAEVQGYPGNITIARRNLLLGSAAVSELAEKLKDEVKPERLKAAEQTLSLILAAEFSILRIDTMERGVGSGVLSLLVEARLLRRRLLSNAEGAAEYGLLPRERVEGIKKGKGQLDTARDNVALSALYREYKAILSGKSPVPEVDIERSGQVGSRLLSLLKTESVTEPPEEPEEIVTALEIRDRFWTLLVQQRELLWKLAGLIVGPKEVDAVVPPLLSQEREKTPQTPEVKQARQEAKEAKEKAKQAEVESKEKARAAAKISKDARKKK